MPVDLGASGLVLLGGVVTAGLPVGFVVGGGSGAGSPVGTAVIACGSAVGTSGVAVAGAVAVGWIGAAVGCTVAVAVEPGGVVADVFPGNPNNAITTANPAATSATAIATSTDLPPPPTFFGDALLGVTLRGEAPSWNIGAVLETAPTGIIGTVARKGAAGEAAAEDEAGTGGAASGAGAPGTTPRARIACSTAFGSMRTVPLGPMSPPPMDSPADGASMRG